MSFLIYARWNFRVNHPHIATPYRATNKTEREVDRKLNRIVCSQKNRQETWDVSQTIFQPPKTSFSNTKRISFLFRFWSSVHRSRAFLRSRFVQPLRPSIFVSPMTNLFTTTHRILESISVIFISYVSLPNKRNIGGTIIIYRWKRIKCRALELQGERLVAQETSRMQLGFDIETRYVGPTTGKNSTTEYRGHGEFELNIVWAAKQHWHR